MIMNGFQSLGHNYSPSHHLCRHAHAVQIKLAGSLIVVILLLGTPTITSLPTPSSVDGVNNNRENSNNVNPNYFDNDQLLAELWQQLCWKKMTNSSDALSLPFYVGSDAGRRGGSEEQVAEAIGRLLRTIIANDGDEGDFASVTCEEEPLPSPSPQLALEATQNQKLFSNDNEFDERVSRDTNSDLPFGDDDENIQRQVIFIEIPETKVNVHVHQSPPQTAIVVLPPMDDTHTFRIVDMRNPSGETATPNVHFLTNFGSNKIDSEISSGLQSNLHQMGQSQSIKVSDQRNFLNNQEHMPFKGVPLPISIPAAITARFNQQNQKHFQQINTNGATQNFEIQPAYNGYFFH